MTTFGEVKFVCFGTVKVAPNVVSTKFAFAHSPAPSARAHLIRHGFAVTPSPRGEGSVAPNAVSTKFDMKQNLLL